jgi:hypothetical protein
VLLTIDRAGMIAGYWFTEHSTPQRITGAIGAAGAPIVATARGVDGSELGQVTLAAPSPGHGGQFAVHVDPSEGPWLWRGELSADPGTLALPDQTTFSTTAGFIHEASAPLRDSWRPREVSVSKTRDDELRLQGERDGQRITATLRPTDVDGLYDATIHVGHVADRGSPTPGPAIDGRGVVNQTRDGSGAEVQRLYLFSTSGRTTVLLMADRDVPQPAHSSSAAAQ